MGEPVETFRIGIFPIHCDQFNHMNARWYAAFFDDASYHLYLHAGLSFRRMAAEGGIVPVLARTTISYERELVVGSLLVIRSGFVRLGGKSIERVARMYDAETEELCATERAVDVCFDQKTRKAAVIPNWIRQPLEPLLMASEKA